MNKIQNPIRFLFLLFFIIILILLYPKNQKLPDNVKINKIIIEKSKRCMMLMNDNKTVKKYTISLGENPTGHKQQEGDERTPEGKYIIDYRNPKSSCYLSFHISYPKREDKSRASQRGVSPGGNIMIHGMLNGWGWIGRLHLLTDWTNGCIAITNKEMDELWKFVPNGTPIEILP